MFIVIPEQYFGDDQKVRIPPLNDGVIGKTLINDILKSVKLLSD